MPGRASAAAGAARVAGRAASGDASEAIATRVREAFERGEPLAVRGADSRRAWGHDPAGEPLSTLEHRGIVAYEPTELTLTARAGTPVADVAAALAEHRQMLAFEPPDGGGTLGGAIACGLSGPRRPYAGAARDFTLGARIVDGRGRVLSFGGEVMKNVAGYDVSRLQVGAFGTLGVLLEVSLKVLPMPEAVVTLHQELAAETDAAASLVALARRPLPLGGSLVRGRERWLRLEGSRLAVDAAARELGGERLPAPEAPWRAVRERTHDFFDDPAPLWRVSVADHAPPLELPGDRLLDWGGAQRWLASEAPARAVFAAARAAGGHATRLRRVAHGDVERVDGPLFQPLDAPLLALHRRLRDGFDPKRVLNRGRHRPELD